MRKFLSLVSDPLKFGRGHLARQIQIQRQFERLELEYAIKINSPELTSTNLTQATALILDLSINDHEPAPNFMDQFSETIGFDWSGSFIPERNFVIIAHPGREYPASKYKSTGLQNMVLRNEISTLKLSRRPTDPNYVLLSLGYSAGTNAYQEALSLTEHFPKILKKLAAGRELEIPPSKHIEVVIDSPDFIQLLAASRAVISNGGTTYVESLLLKKSVLPIPQNEDEKYFVDAIHPLTYPDETLPGFRRMDQVAASKAGINTQGAERLCKIILEKL
jgi:hypothetical protein